MDIETTNNKICIVRKDIADEDRGGISFYYKGIIKELTNWEWDVTVITQLPFTKTKAHVINVPVEEDYNKSTVNVRKALEAIDVDIIEASNYKFELLDYLLKNKIKKNKPISIVRSEPSGVTCLFGDEYMYGERTQSQLADYNIAVSNFAAQDTERQYGIRNDQVIYLGVDLERLYSIEHKDYLESGYMLDGKGETKRVNHVLIDDLISKDKINIFWSGKPTHMKGYDYLENLVEATSDRFNFILNETPVSHTIKKNKNNSKVSTLWELSREDQINLWKRCDVTLLASRVEGFSLVSAESMLLGKPLIVNTQCEIIREFPMDKEIMFFDPNSVKGFVDAVHEASKIEFKLTHKQLLFFDSKRLALETHLFYKKVLGFKKLKETNVRYV